MVLARLVARLGRQPCRQADPNESQNARQIEIGDPETGRLKKIRAGIGCPTEKEMRPQRFLALAGLLFSKSDDETEKKTKQLQQC